MTSQDVRSIMMGDRNNQEMVSRKMDSKQEKETKMESIGNGGGGGQ